jgi:hypothetical protein
MGLKILCSGYLVRYPLGGHSWHQLQSLVGLRRLGHDVTFLEEWGWPSSCYDPERDEMTASPSYGISYLRSLLRPHGLDDHWCYLAEDGTAHGMPREQLAQLCRECDVYFSLGNINWIPELEECKRRVLVDGDPVFTQIEGHGLGQFSRYHTLFTSGENVHRRGCEMPTAGERWLPTRQPVVLDLWEADVGARSAAFTTVANWSAYGDSEHAGVVYGQKDHEFERFISLPRETGEPMEIALGDASAEVRQRLTRRGWRLADALEITRTPSSYQDYLRASRAEFSVTKHAFAVARCGVFSERSTSYLATGRPVVIQDTGFSEFLPCGAGVLPYRTRQEAKVAIRHLNADYEAHCRAARRLVEEFFDARRVLPDLLERSL